MKLEVVTIGTELLLGYTLDSNGADLGRELAAVGVEVVRRTSVADRPDAIRAALQEALDRTGVVITTGGLGPTRDDVTKAVAAEIFDRPLVLDPALLKALEARFVRLGRTPMPPLNRTQAEVPQGASVLPNAHGTAPGLWLEDGERLAILLPGVPRELRGLLVEEVLPRLRSRAATSGLTPSVVRSRTVRTTGIAESALAERVAPLAEGLGPLTLAFLPSVAGVDLRLTAWELPATDADDLLANAARRLAEAAGEHYYGLDDIDLAAVVLDLLRRDGHRLGVAESCTGGLVGGRLTAVPGASDTFLGGVVAYADAVKTAMLDVPAVVLAEHGAVSEPTVRAMAEGVQRRLRVDCAVAVTGIAGPGGGSPQKPVGTVWLAARVAGETRTLCRMFPGDRDEIRRRAAQAALDLLRRVLV
ncbi:MAG TPA: competence/damage-inducible protein A [Gemmatimonadales bacterium]|nr:competence/damage-inducible protein A [Gemmatimonadales bacterium]